MYIKECYREREREEETEKRTQTRERERLTPITGVKDIDGAVSGLVDVVDLSDTRTQTPSRAPAYCQS